MKNTAELKAKNKASISIVIFFHAMMHFFNAQAILMQEMYKGIYHNRLFTYSDSGKVISMM